MPIIKNILTTLCAYGKKSTTVNYLQELASQSPFGLNFTEEIAFV